MINASDASGDDVPFGSNVFGGLGFFVFCLERGGKRWRERERERGFWLV